MSDKTIRPLKELYSILLEYREKYNLSYGICSSIGGLYLNPLSPEEYYILLGHFQKQKPNIFSKFYWHPSFHQFYGEGFWWKLSEKGAKQRNKFIQSLIDKL